MNSIKRIKSKPHSDSKRMWMSTEILFQSQRTVQEVHLTENVNDNLRCASVTTLRCQTCSNHNKSLLMVQTRVGTFIDETKKIGHCWFYESITATWLVYNWRTTLLFISLNRPWKTCPEILQAVWWTRLRVPCPTTNSVWTDKIIWLKSRV